MDVLIALFVIAATLQPRLDAAREREARGAASEDDRAFLMLARCEPLDDAALEYRIEQLRAARMTKDERATTVWRELDALVFETNAKPNALIWPRERERWPNEAAHVKAEKRECTEEVARSLDHELTLTERAIAKRPSPALELHRAILLHRLQRRTTATTPLLAAERVYRDPNAAPTALREAIATYQTIGPDGRVREIELALRTKDDVLIEHALRDDLEGEAHAYALAWRLLRLDAQPDRLLAEARRAWPSLQKNAANKPLIDDLLRGALVRRPFDDATLQTLIDLYGKAGLERQVYKLATLALSRGELETARAALTWIAKREGRTQEQAQRQLGVVALLVGDAAMLEVAAKAQKDLPAAVEAWLLMARTSPLAQPKALQPLLTLLPPGPLLTELKELLAQKPVKVWKVALTAAQGALPEPPPVDFALPEVYSLIE